MSSVKINKITINYSIEEENDIKKIKEFINKNNFLFQSFITIENDIEINIRDFDLLIREIIIKLLKSDDFQTILNQPYVLAKCYFDLLIMENPHENKILFKAGDSITKEMLYFIISVKYYNGNIDKISAFLRNDDEGSKQHMYEWLKANQRFHSYNYVLKLCLIFLEQNDLFLFDNMDLIIDKMTKDNMDYIRSLSKMEDKKISLQSLSNNDFDSLVKGFFSYIDAPQDWVDDYEFLVNNGFIYFKYNPNVNNGKCFLDKKDNQWKIEIECDGIINKFIIFAHEFMHYISFQKGVPKFSLLEFPSIYYENIAARYLVSVGYNEEIVKKVIDERKSNNFDVCCDQLPFWLDLYQYKNKGFIQKEEMIDKFENDKRAIRDMAEVFNNEKKDLSDFIIALQDYDSEKKAETYCDRNIEKFIKNGSLIFNGYQYMIDSALVYDILDTPSKEIDKKMIHVTNHLCDYTLLGIMDYLNITIFSNAPNNSVRRLIKEKVDNHKMC